MKKILIALIACMFLLSVLPGIVGETEADEDTFKERKYKEDRKIIPVYTAHGLENVPAAKGKPGAFVIITKPVEDAIVSGTVEITINSNYNPTITIDGTAVESGLSYNWVTTGYADGTHTIGAAARGVTDTVTVTVNNNGGGENTAPVVSITSPSNGATVSGTVSITVDANDAEDGALAADIYIDDSHVANANSYSWVTTGYADGSSHTIRADVEDTEDLTDSDSITVTVNNGGGDVNKYALVIGISDYEGTANDLNYCDDDAVDWKIFLQSKGYTVTELIDDDATADGIVAAVDNLLALEDGDDYVVLTYSGHGAKSPYGSSIISQDLKYMTHGWLEQKFDSSDSQHIYFAFDACVIGDFEGLIDNNKVGAFASDRRYSYDGLEDMQNGVFTYYQMEGWDVQNFDNFEDDGNYAVSEFKAWAKQYRIRVDPFVSDTFAGPMMP